MAKAHAQGTESPKKHGDAMEKAMEDADRHAAQGKNADLLPMPESGGHERSHAAHLGHAHEHTKPEGNLRHGVAPGELREPPMVQQRIGKQHR
jgi:hypothetical protein